MPRRAMPRRAASRTLARALGNRIRQLREGADVTQENLAWDCDLTKGFVSLVEAGKKMPSLLVLFHMADRLGIEPAEFLRFPRPRTTARHSPEGDKRQHARGKSAGKGRNA